MRITGGSVFDLEHGFCEKDLCTDGSVFAGTSSDGEIVDASVRISAMRLRRDSRPWQIMSCPRAWRISARQE